MIICHLLSTGWDTRNSSIIEAECVLCGVYGEVEETVEHPASFVIKTVFSVRYEIKLKHSYVEHRIWSLVKVRYRYLRDIDWDSPRLRCLSMMISFIPAGSVLRNNNACQILGVFFCKLFTNLTARGNHRDMRIFRNFNVVCTVHHVAMC